MRRLRVSLIGALVLAVLGLSWLPVVKPASAQTGTVINSAVFSIYQEASPSPSVTVNVHRITAPWNEPDVTWASFGDAFDPTIIGSFDADGPGWHSVTVTSLVQSWVDNPTQNYGLLLEQGLTPYTNYVSSEDDAVANRPKLDVCYTRNGGPETCLTIQRLGATQGKVADTYVWSGVPDYNGGDSTILFAGVYTNAQGSGEKYTLVRFELTTPTAVRLQSLTARSSVSPELALALIGAVGAIGMGVLRRRRER
jgi:hypothetical protein